MLSFPPVDRTLHDSIPKNREPWEEEEESNKFYLIGRDRKQKRKGVKRRS